MKSVHTLRAAAFRGLRPRLFDRVIPQQLLEEIKEEYAFTQADIVPDGFRFTFGKFKKGAAQIYLEQVLIQYFGIEATSIGAMTRSSTDDVDSFLDHFIPWMKQRYGIDEKRQSSPAYHSQLEFVLDKVLSDKFKPLQTIGEMIAKLMQDYGVDCPTFEMTSLSMHFDQTQYRLKPLPLAFAVERRVGVPFAENKYYSTAPLKTSDHKALLEYLEKIL
jgi:hypothetical protein